MTKTQTITSLGTKIIVIQAGFVYVGEVDILEQTGTTWLRVSGTRNIRVWGTTDGLGQLATKGPTLKTVLDVAGTIYVPMHAVLHLLDTAAAVWKKK
jgi:hypothetical protein